MSALFWFSSTATRFSRHLMYSFFFRRHSRAASLPDRGAIGQTGLADNQLPRADSMAEGQRGHSHINICS